MDANCHDCQFANCQVILYYYYQEAQPSSSKLVVTLLIDAAWAEPCIGAAACETATSTEQERGFEGNGESYCLGDGRQNRATTGAKKNTNRIVFKKTHSPSIYALCRATDVFFFSGEPLSGSPSA